MNEVFAFVGLEAASIADTRARNAGDSWEAAPSTFQALVDYYEPHNERLCEVLGRRFSWAS